MISSGAPYVICAQLPTPAHACEGIKPIKWCTGGLLDPHCMYKHERFPGQP